MLNAVLAAASALSRLHESFDGALVRDFLLELGLVTPPEILTTGNFADSCSNAKDDLALLEAAVQDLADAIDTNDETAMQAAGLVVTASVVRVLGSFKLVSDEIEASGNLLPGADPAVYAEFASKFIENTVIRAALEYLEEDASALFMVMRFLGIITEAPKETLVLPQIEHLMNDPANAIQNKYHFGTGEFSAASLFGDIEEIAYALGVPTDLAAPTAGQPLTLRTVRFNVVSDSDNEGQYIEIVFVQNLGPNIILKKNITKNWDLNLSTKGEFTAGIGFRIRPPARLVLIPGAPAARGELILAFLRKAPNGAGKIPLIGSLQDTRLEASSVSTSIGISYDSNQNLIGLLLASDLQGGGLVLKFIGGDGFLSQFLPGEMRFTFEIGLLWSNNDGLSLSGGAGLSSIYPVNVTFGPMTISLLGLSIVPGPNGIFVETKIAAGIEIGPISASVDGVGVALDLMFHSGNLGILNLAPRFIPPTGLGLDIDAGPISGGGFVRFDEPNGRYGGMFELKLGVVGVQATALLDTRLPGGRSGYALLVLLRASFPPVQLGFGLSLSSVGGLLALNRKVNVDALRNRIASGTAGRILAPEDPVRNAPVLLADLGAVFPPAEGVVVVGPTLQLSWMQIVRFDIGVFIELPGPRRVVIIGSARASIEKPSGGKPYLQIRLDVLGELNFAARTVSFDAVLIDSHLMEILELSGGAAFRLSWGAEPYAVLTVGGFHPAYNPAPLVFPSSLTRIAMVRGTPADALYLRFEGYFAITSNTRQFGASVEAIITLGDFNIRGFLAFDALIEFQPLHFQFAIAASVKVRFRSRNLGGLTLRGEMSGPGPVVFRGRVCFEIMWFDICFEETFELGSSNPPWVAPVSSAVAMLAIQLEDPRNVHAMESVDRWVTVEPAKDTELPVVSPLGQAVWSQQRAPLGLLLQRFEGAPLSRPETVTVSGAQVTGPEPEWFAPGSFTELTDADALNRPAFSRLQAGARLGLGGTHDGPSKDKSVTVRQIRLPLPAVELTAEALPAWLQRATAGRLGSTERDVVMPAIAVHDEEWSLHAGGGITTGLSQPQAHQLARLGAAGTAVAAVDTLAALAF